MTFNKKAFQNTSGNAKGSFGVVEYSYKTSDSLADVGADGYFNEVKILLNKYDLIKILSITDGGVSFSSVYVSETEPNVKTITIDGSDIGSLLQQEIERAEAAESNLQSQLDAKASEESLQDEIAARNQGDEELGEDITNEATARQTADATLQSNIDTKASATDLAAEVLRAGQAEATIQLALTNEVNRAMQKENLIDGELATKQPKTANDDVLYAGKNGGWIELDDINAEWGHIAGDINSQLDLKEELETVQGNIDSAAQTLGDAITQEVQDRTNADTGLQTQLDLKLEVVKTDEATIWGDGTDANPITTTQP